MSIQRNWIHFDQLRKFKINRYTIAIACFIVWIAFFDRHNLINQFKLGQTIQELNDEKGAYNEQYEMAVQAKEDLLKDKEKYAREHHNFMKEGEELFIIKK